VNIQLADLSTAQTMTISLLLRVLYIENTFIELPAINGKKIQPKTRSVIYGEKIYFNEKENKFSSCANSTTTTTTTTSMELVRIVSDEALARGVALGHVIFIKNAYLFLSFKPHQVQDNFHFQMISI